MEKNSRVCAHINLDAVLYNAESIHQNVAQKTKIMAVIKTDGYGHGAVEIAREFAETSAQEAKKFIRDESNKVIKGARELFDLCRHNPIRERMRISDLDFTPLLDFIERRHIKKATNHAMDLNDYKA